MWTPSRRRILLAAPALLIPSRLRGDGLSGSVTPQSGGGIGKFFDGGVSKSGVGGFTPTSLFSSNTGGWWDPSDHTTTFQNAGGTTPANTAGQTVAWINDKSGNGNFLGGGVGPFPTLQNSGSLWWLQFDGATQFIQNTFTLAQPMTRISAVRQISWTNGNRLFDGGTTNTAGLLQNSASPEVQMYAGAFGPADASDLTVGADHVVSEFFSGASSSLVVDNGASNTGNPSTAAPGGLTIGALGAGTSAFSNIRWYGCIAIGRALTGPETANCRTFFGAKAGL
jgi:hypothetical protein